MIRVYLDYSYTESNKNKTSILVESESLNLKSVSYHYDSNSKNVMAIVEGVDADKLTAFMIPPHPLGKAISDMHIGEISRVTDELNSRNINTSGSITCGDLLDNICKTFNTDFKTLGDIINRDFS